MSIKNTASAQWQGDLKSGQGTVSTGNGGLNNLPYSFKTRFEGEKGANPEELIGAAHSACFSMALSAELGKAGITADKIETKATVTLDKVGDGFSITASHLDVAITAPGSDQAAIQAAAESAEKNCPISKVLNATVTMSATINGAQAKAA